MRKKLNNKGFTLIELLAVIVILGILMLVAIPQVTKYIEQSRRDTFADTARAYVNSARYMYLNDEIEDSSGTCTVGQTVKIPISEINVENSNSTTVSGGGKKISSPFGGELVGYVEITATAKTDKDEEDYDYTYTVYMKDGSKKWGLYGVKEGDIKGKKVIRNSKNDITNLDATTCS